MIDECFTCFDKTIPGTSNPSSYFRESGNKSPLRLDDVFSIAKLLKIKWELGHKGSVLIANPIPVEFEIPFSKMEVYINEALKEAGAFAVFLLCC